MSDVKFTVGGAMEDEASRRFIDAWHRAERDETFQERHLAFESWDALARVLTGKRMELLRYVRRHNVKSIRSLARKLAAFDPENHPEPVCGPAEWQREPLRISFHPAGRDAASFDVVPGSAVLVEDAGDGLETAAPVAK
jgi:hypothetical protein